MRLASVRRAVLGWAATLDRPLPWRGERDPYRVLVSEVMLQQTQASRVAPIYRRFIERFPTVETLAGAEAADALRAWENLGYNRRALNLWRAARDIVASGGFPRSIDDLEHLPGIGAYTARAIASFAFGVDVGVVDANVRRVLMRMTGTAEGVQARADSLVPPGDSAAWNQAMIDLGAVVCRARAPRCEACPVARLCTSRGSAGSVASRPPAPRFETTTRYARGRIVAALRRSCIGAVTVGDLARTTGLEPGRVRSAIRALERDGIVSRRGSRVALGPAALAGPGS